MQAHVLANTTSSNSPLTSRFPKSFPVTALQARSPPSKYSRWHFIKYFAIIRFIFPVSNISVTALPAQSVPHTLDFYCSNVPSPNSYGLLAAFPRALATGFIIRITWGALWPKQTQRLQMFLGRQINTCFLVFFFKLYWVWIHFL